MRQASRADTQRRGLRRAHELALRVGARAAYCLNGVGRDLRDLERLSGLSPEEVEAEVMARLRGQLARAFAEVPWYREVARREGLTAEVFRSYADLGRLPVLTKRDIRESRELLRSEKPPYGAGVPNSTAGSTGEPLHFYQDRNYHRVNWAVKSWGYEMCGYRLGEPIAVLTGSHVDAARHDSGVGKLASVLLRNAMMVDAFGTTAEGLVGTNEEIVRHDPVLLAGYASALALYTRFLRDTGAPRPRPAAVQATAEMLSEEDRALMEETLGCAVFNRYGCREVGMIAHECACHEGLHVAAIAQIVEVVDDEGRPCAPGETGRALVTNLTNAAMPLVRYDIGDLAAWAEGPCACGSALPRLTEIAGRVCEIIRCPGGKLLHSAFFSGVMRSAGGVEAFQIVQETLHDLVVRFVALPGAEVERTKARVREMVAERADPALRVRFEVYDGQLPMPPSGKHRFVVSLLHEPAPWAQNPTTGNQ
jgi:phenylacetate-CoA ligase